MDVAPAGAQLGGELLVVPALQEAQDQDLAGLRTEGRAVEEGRQQGLAGQVLLDRGGRRVGGGEGFGERPLLARRRGPSPRLLFRRRQALAQGHHEEATVQVGEVRNTAAKGDTG